MGFGLVMTYGHTCTQNNNSYSRQFTRVAPDILEILVLDELHDDVFLWLNLQHLQCEAEERSGLDVSAVNTPDKLQLHGLVHDQLGCEEEYTVLYV